METGKYFDPYEVIGLITPGTVAALLLTTEAPAFRALLGKDGLSVGDFGLFILVAFVLGHLVQAVGNVLEYLVWPFGNLPSFWVRATDQKLLTREQRAELERKIQAMEGTSEGIASFDADSWRAVTTRAFARIRGAGQSFRIDNSNRTYGLCRGLVAAFVIALGWYAYSNWADRERLGLIAIMLIAAIWRMRRAGVHYARGLWLEFIDLK